MNAVPASEPSKELTLAQTRIAAFEDELAAVRISADRDRSFRSIVITRSDDVIACSDPS